MAVTIKDVAKLANVAPSTVSRVIADNPRISEETKERVREAMKELGYHPNFIARSLANQSTQALGLVMPSSADKVFQNPFFPEVIRGISTMAHEKDYALYMSTGETEDEIFEGVVKMVQGKRVDGIVLLYSRIDDEVINYLVENKFPFTVIGKPFKDADSITHVDNDNYLASKEVTEYLIGLGHDRIAFVGGSLNLVVTIDRLLGYEKALRNSNLVYRDDYIVQEEFLKEGGREAVKELLALTDPPTALVVTDDIMALGVLNTLAEMGISVPDDISVVSFNNSMFSEVSRPPLTSVNINIFDLGCTAAKYVIEQIENPSGHVKRVIVPHKLVKRQSCKEKSLQLKTVE
ncbi:LacI family DNA-binding transcriptional regulator [Bacillus salitolerans]|uniref:LacI family DNA-binding transcriptional regulator n=1 Tax=Bacillus salitolerans TaxID=1437434 RepID=A0ABW4M022_9BACI